MELRSALVEARTGLSASASVAFAEAGFDPRYSERFIGIFDSFVRALPFSNDDLVQAGWSTGIETAVWLHAQGAELPDATAPLERIRARLLFDVLPTLLDRRFVTPYYSSIGRFLMGYARGMSSGDYLLEYEYVGEISREMAQAADEGDVADIACAAAAALLHAEAACVSTRHGTVWQIERQLGMSDDLYALRWHDSEVHDVRRLMRGEVSTYEDLSVETPALQLFPQQYGLYSSISAPLMIDGRCAGAVTAFRRQARAFNDRDVAIAHVLALQLATNLKEKRSTAELRVIAESMPQIVWTARPSGAIDYYNERWREYTGLDPAQSLGNGWLRAVPEADANRLLEAFAQSLDSGENIAQEMQVWHNATARYRWMLVRARPHRDVRGTIYKWVGTLTDIEDSKRSQEQQYFLAEASRILAGSLDLQTTLANVAQLVVPLYADWCEIDVLDERRGLETVAMVHRDAEMDATAQQLVGGFNYSSASDEGVYGVLKSGASVLMPEIDPAMPLQVLNNEAAAAVYTALGFRSAMLVPLSARGRTLGVICFVFSVSGRNYNEEDVAFAEELARRAALAIANAKIFEREHRVAESFQEASLPPTLPTVHGLTLDAVYVAGSNDVQVGGDWYDAVRLLDGRVVVSIGDVAGSGLAAAVTMGNIRQIIRGIAQVHADPSLMLDAADRALRLEHPEQFVTAFVAVIDPVARTMAYASAGHPPAILRAPDGSLTMLADGGLPLGLRDDRESSAGMLEIDDRSLLVMYTDGLTEAFRDPVAGETRLRELVASEEILTQRSPAKFVRERFLERAVARDDVAILTVWVGTAARSNGAFERWSFDSADAAAARRTRREFREGLLERGATHDDVSAAELVLGELVGNVVRYAAGNCDVVVDWSSDAPVLHVLDSGDGFRHIAMLPRDVFSESGRGLFLVTALTRDFHVAKRPGGGSHARAVLALERQRLSHANAVEVVGASLLDAMAAEG